MLNYDFIQGEMHHNNKQMIIRELRLKFFPKKPMTHHKYIHVIYSYRCETYKYPYVLTLIETNSYSKSLCTMHAYYQIESS